jgi:16S rRNA (guanine527-N7)-methyltransferase
MTESEFVKELEKINIFPTENQLEKLEQYYELLIEWNERMNLTSITEKGQVYLKHFYDSLTITKDIDLSNEETLCDIGTGAGFPGVVLKIMYPNLRVTLVDSLNKRINFLEIVIDKLNLKGIVTVASRAEDYSRMVREKYDVVTARAVANTNILLEYSVPLVKIDKYFIPLKGKDENEETFKDAMNTLNVKLVDKDIFLLPIENSQRTILKFQKFAKTDSKYPRCYSDMKKKPL